MAWTPHQAEQGFEHRSFIPLIALRSRPVSLSSFFSYNILRGLLICVLCQILNIKQIVFQPTLPVHICWFWVPSFIPPFYQNNAIGLLQMVSHLRSVYMCTYCQWRILLLEGVKGKKTIQLMPIITFSL